MNDAEYYEYSEQKKNGYGVNDIFAEFTFKYKYQVKQSLFKPTRPIICLVFWGEKIKDFCCQLLKQQIYSQNCHYKLFICSYVIFSDNNNFFLVVVVFFFLSRNFCRIKQIIQVSLYIIIYHVCSCKNNILHKIHTVWY